MDAQEAKNIGVGDRITFKAVTRYSYKKVTRVVNGFYHNGFPTVRFSGWSDFVVSPQEIIEVDQA